jgi:hypothetical protein
MPQTRTITQTVYQFDELDDAAKERARDWYREASYGDTSDFDCEIDEFVHIAEALGIDFDTHEVKLMNGKTRSEPNIYWSVGYCQSDYASFEGTYDYKATAVQQIRHINNDDTWEPLRIAQALAKIQCENAFGIRAKMRVVRDWMSVDEVYDRRDEERDIGSAWKEVEELMHDLARYLYQQLRDQSDYLHSDEAVDESITINEYEFDEEGARI